ncbi:MAG: hypothetical protein ACI85I_001691 [Arenicella sp.]|jgi:hypothetical protein
MKDNNLLKLAQMLLDKSQKKEIIWHKTSREGEYKLEFKKALITIDSWGPENDVDGENKAEIAVYNETGDLVDGLETSDDSKEIYEVLDSLHKAARRIVYKADETFESIYSELKKDGKVGIEKPSIMRDGDINNLPDLPF